MECCAGTLEFQMSQHIYTGHVTQRIGNANEKGHPWGIFPCRDGWVSVAGGRHWKDLVEIMDVPGLKDPKFSSVFYCIQHRDEIDALMSPWLLEHDKEEIFELFQAHDLPCGWVRSTEDVVHCPQLEARGFFQKVNHPATGEVLYPAGPFNMTETPWQAKRAPLLGEHNEEVLCGRLGYTREDLVKFAQLGVI